MNGLKILAGVAIAETLNGKFAVIQDAKVLVLSPPPVKGIGTSNGFKMMVQDRGDQGYAVLYQATQALVGAAYGSGKLHQVYSG